MSEQTVFVLRETLASKRVGHDVWFKEMTIIGPRATEIESERAIFTDRIAAACSPAMKHLLSSYEVVEVSA